MTPPTAQPTSPRAPTAVATLDPCWGDEPPPSTVNGAVPSIVAANCGQCHGGAATHIGGPAGRFDYSDLRLSIEAGLLIPCDADRSPLVRRMEDGSMPPESSGLPRVFQADIDAVRRFVEWQCTPEELACNTDPSGTSCDLVRAEQVLESHCGSCHGRAAARSLNVIEPSYIGDMAALIREGDVIPCQSQLSPLIIRLRDEDNPMPPRALPCALQGPFFTTTARPTEASVSIVASFIDGLCAEALAGTEEASARAEVEALLGERCGACHGDGGADADALQGGLGGIDDYVSLVERGLVVPCASDASPLLRRMRDGSMPPADSLSAALDDSELARVAAVIDGPCRR